MELATLLEDLSSTAADEFKTMPEVVEAGDDVDVVAVVADLKSSTQLGTGSKAPSTASIYEAGTGGVVKIFDSFAADFCRSRATAHSLSSGVASGSSGRPRPASPSKPSRWTSQKGSRPSGRTSLRRDSRSASPATECW